MDGFIANLYEFFGFANLGNFSNDMYNNGFYLPLFIIMLSSCFIVAVCYYYVINHPRLNRWWQWLLFNVCTAVLNFGLVWIVASDKIVRLYEEQQMASPYDWSSYFILSTIALFWTVICFFIVSFIMKWWSRNCKHSPFL